jgi:hypothetical protein
MLVQHNCVSDWHLSDYDVCMNVFKSLGWH